MRAVLFWSLLVWKNELLASSFHLRRFVRSSITSSPAPSSVTTREDSRSTSAQRGRALRAVRSPFRRESTNDRIHKKDDMVVPPRRHRFDRTSDAAADADVDIVLTIHGRPYNVTTWAKAHPGGIEALSRLRGKDATRAFESAHHSARARALLTRFEMATDAASGPVEPSTQGRPATTAETNVLTMETLTESATSRVKRKLFTKEDPIGIHKYLGLFCLLHFVYRYGQMLFFDPSAGLGSRPGAAAALHGVAGTSGASMTTGGVGWIAPLCLLPHAALSLSSLIFRTVPRDRVVGKPMIWQEYRVHNIAFGVRSVIASLLCHLSIRTHHAPAWRRICVASTAIAVLATQVVADWGTRQFRANEHESTTATMPYWDGCSVATQKRFKSFYAYCQFMATLACLSVMNPAWPLAVLLAIQGASLLMTLVRKGLISARAYHYGYTFTLLVPYAVGFRSLAYTARPEFLAMLALGAVLYQLRRRGTDKYLLWVPVIAARVAVGDRFLSYDVW